MWRAHTQPCTTSEINPLPTNWQANTTDQQSGCVSWRSRYDEMWPFWGSFIIRPFFLPGYELFRPSSACHKTCVLGYIDKMLVQINLTYLMLRNACAVVACCFLPFMCHPFSDLSGTNEDLHTSSMEIKAGSGAELSGGLHQRAASFEVAVLNLADNSRACLCSAPCKSHVCWVWSLAWLGQRPRKMLSTEREISYWENFHHWLQPVMKSSSIWHFRLNEVWGPKCYKDLSSID